MKTLINGYIRLEPSEKKVSASANGSSSPQDSVVVLEQLDVDIKEQTNNVMASSSLMAKNIEINFFIREHDLSDK